jgi:DNA ligase-associated metallophosphoesterase
MPSHLPFHWRGHRLELLGAKAVWVPAQGLLLLADLHLGKAETFQAHGIPLPSDGDRATLNALLALAHHWRPREVVVLGDLIHSRLGLTAELRQTLAALPSLLGCPLSLVGGNHETGSWLEGLPQQASGARGPLWLSHSPEQPPAAAGEQLNICGHLHPVALIGSGSDRLRLPCFSYGEDTSLLVLPSFGHLTGGHPCDDRSAQWLVVEGSILPWHGGGSPVGAPRPRRQGHAPHHRG